MEDPLLPNICPRLNAEGGDRRLAGAQHEREWAMSAAEGTSPPGSAPAPATPEAWGGAARLRTPVLSLRNAMEQQAQVCSHLQSHAAQVLD